MLLYINIKRLNYYHMYNCQYLFSLLNSIIENPLAANFFGDN